MRTIRYAIGPDDGGKTVEQFLRRAQGFSGGVVTTLKKLPEGLLVNGTRVRTVDHLSCGDILEINLPDEPKRMPLCDIPVPILYEDDDVIVYNKPAGMPCHQSGGHIYDTLSSVYAAHCARTGEITSFRPLNRLDKDTTGAVVAAKNRFAAGKLWKRVRKRYFALIRGEPPFPDGLIDLPILPEHPLEMRRIVDPDGQEARTEFHLLGKGEGVSLLGLILHTGRTHQIRVHFSHLGLPLLGDDFYGGSNEPGLGRQALHCGMVRFPHAITGEKIEVAAPFPEDLLEVMSRRGIAWREEWLRFPPVRNWEALPKFLRKEQGTAGRSEDTK